MAGGGGANAMVALKTRVVSGTPPQAVQMRGPAIQDWADQGVLAPLDSIAGQRSRELPAAIDASLKYDGHYDADGIQGRPWNLATAMLIDGKAGIFFMGDWANGEFATANKKPDQHDICAPRPDEDALGDALQAGQLPPRVWTSSEQSLPSIFVRRICRTCS